MTLFTPKKYDINRAKLISSMLKLLPFYNWDKELVSQAEQECGFVKNYHILIFPSGMPEITEYFHENLDSMCLELLNQYEKPKRVRDQVALFLITRIKLLSKSSHNKFSKYFLHIANITLGNRVAWHSCDSIWRYAGDNSTDFNYYTKRGLLLSVYYLGILYYMADESENATATEKYVMKSIENIISIASLKNKIKFPDREDIPFLRLF